MIRQSKYVRGIAYALTLVALYVVAWGSRHAILRANYAQQGGRVPFTLEGALQFRNAVKVYHGEGIPRHDSAIQYPEGIAVFQTDTVGAEYLYGLAARWLPAEISLETRVRWITLGWFCLTVPWLALWVSARTRRRSAGVVSALFYAVSLAAVIRSTGLELSRENFALPFLLAHLALDAFSVRAAESGGPYRRYALASAVALGLALAAWDMIQFYLLLWVGTWLIRGWQGRMDVTAQRWRAYAPSVAIILIAGLSPYHRAHGLWVSPLLGMVYGLLLLGLVTRYRPRLGRWGRFACLITPFLLVGGGGWIYGAHYHHFAELMWAKLRFWNQKPMDPAALTFNQRIMWVPALNSATWPLTFMFFPAIFLLYTVYGLFSLVFIGLRRRVPFSAEEGLPLFPMLLVSVGAYIFFVRFHVYVAIFACAGLGAWWAWSLSGPRRVHVWWVVPLTMLAGLIEAMQVWEDPGRWGRPNVYYAELKEVTEWLQEYVAPDPVLANFGVSSSLLAYGGCPVILHPKFETVAIRRRVEAYGRALFQADEEQFRNWAEDHGAAYYVYAVGEFATRHPELQMRYFVDALDPPPYAAARTFEFEPDRVRYFEYLWGNRKYRVFRLITRADEARADYLTIRARRALARENLDDAERWAWDALSLFPAQYHAREVVAQVTVQRESAVVTVPGEDESVP